MENMSELEVQFEMDSPLSQPKTQFNFHSVYSQKPLNATNTNYEEYRIRTFKSWPVQAPVQYDRLARAGFYYLGKGLEVICFSCGGKISDWNYGDIAMQKHSTFFPNCPFVNNQSNNVPLSKRIQDYDHQNTKVNKPLSERPVAISEPSTSVNYPNGFHYSQEHSPASHGRAYSPPQRIPLQTIPKDFQIRMRHENERLKTFSGKWPLDYISPVELARCGFYYLDIQDKVQCAFCHGVLTKWEPGDKPFVEHKNNFPLCPLMMGHNVGNVPRGEDICGANNPSSRERIYMPNSGPENRSNPSVESLENIGVALHKGPHYPSQASKDARLRSFLPWPQHSPVRAEELVEAGFFYIGISDNVKCFYCDGGLNNWEAGDDPWMEHAHWFPNCYFVRLNKGPDFIKQSLARGHSSPQRRLLSSSGRTIELTSSGSERSLSREVSSSSDVESSLEEMHPPSPNLSSLDEQVDEAMRSNLVQAFLGTNAYPAHLVRLAILRKIQLTGSSVHNVDELSEAIFEARNEHQHSESRLEVQNPEELVKSNIGLEDQKKLILFPQTLEAKTELSLEEENRQLKEQRLCKICMDQEVGVVFLPCGHLIACVQCAPALTDCALCRTAIKGTIRTFLS